MILEALHPCLVGHTGCGLHEMTQVRAHVVPGWVAETVLSFPRRLSCPGRCQNAIWFYIASSNTELRIPHFHAWTRSLLRKVRTGVCGLASYGEPVKKKMGCWQAMRIIIPSTPGVRNVSHSLTSARVLGMVESIFYTVLGEVPEESTLRGLSCPAGSGSLQNPHWALEVRARLLMQSGHFPQLFSQIQCVAQGKGPQIPQGRCWEGGLCELTIWA